MDSITIQRSVFTQSTPFVVSDNNEIILCEIMFCNEISNRERERERERGRERERERACVRSRWGSFMVKRYNGI